MDANRTEDGWFFSDIDSVPIIGDLLGLLFPDRCTGCHSRVKQNSFCRMLCRSCRKSLLEESGGQCRRCAMYLGPGTRDRERCRNCRDRTFCFQRARSLTPYVPPIPEWIGRIKYARHPILALDLGRMLGRYLVEKMRGSEVDALVPVPLRPAREVQRGFNQANLVARGAHEYIETDLYPDALQKRTRTTPQASLGRVGRMQNLSGDDFSVYRPGAVSNRHILLLDDVMTTGSTLDACARALLDGGAEKVSAAVIAR